MASNELGIERTGTSELVVQALPDGSTAVFQVATKNVYSLNPTAAAAWEACESATTLSHLAAAMSHRLNAPISEELAQEAVSELAAVGLVSVTPTDAFGTSRRQMLKQVAGVALPVVLVLTGAEQRAHAQHAASAPETTPPPTTTGGPGPTTAPPGTTGPPLTIIIIKGVGDINPVPLQGAEFDIKNSKGIVVASIVTDATGRASATLPAGTYTLVETFAPGGPFQPFPPSTFTLVTNNQTLDIHNLLASET